MDTKDIFPELMVIMEIDNGGHFHYEDSDFIRAKPAIEGLVEAGFFQDDPTELDDSFWMMAAGEETERETYFEKAKEYHDKLSDVLNDVFNRSEPCQC